MKVVLDTNVLLITLKLSSVHRPIFDALLKKEFDLAVTTDILLEYQEIIGQRSKPEIGEKIVDLILRSSNTNRTTTRFRWNAIAADPDDDKFVDCAVSASVDFLVTNDKHFKALDELDFPKVKVISANEFLEIIENL